MLPRRSTTVTRVPSAANIDAYSMPMIPAPTTTIDDGICSRSSTPSESTIRLPSNSISGGCAGRVPVASTMLSALTTTGSSSRLSVIIMVFGLVNDAVPW